MKFRNQRVHSLLLLVGVVASTLRQVSGGTLHQHVTDLLENLPSDRDLTHRDLEEANMTDVCQTKLSPVINDERFQDAICECDMEGSAIGATCRMQNVCLENNGKTFTGDLMIKMIYFILPMETKKDILDTIVDTRYEACFTYHELYEKKTVCVEDMGLMGDKPTCGVKVDGTPCNGCMICDYQSMGTAYDCSNHFEDEMLNQCMGSPVSDSIVRFIDADTRVSTNCKEPGASLAILSFIEATFVNFWNQIPEEGEPESPED